MLIYRADKIGESLIKQLENCRLEAYPDSKGVWTIGYGITSYPNGQLVKEGDKITQDQAELYFYQRLTTMEIKIQKYIKDIPLNQNQINALISFTWNVGIDEFKKSTLLKVIKQNPNNYKEIEQQFMRWKYSGGKIIEGLINRRKAEAYLYIHGLIKYFYDE